MRRTLLLAGAALTAGLGSFQPTRAADSVPVALGVDDLAAIAIRRVTTPPTLPLSIQGMSIEGKSIEGGPFDTGTSTAPTDSVETSRPRVPDGPAVAEPLRDAPAPSTAAAIVLAPADLQAVGPRPLWRRKPTEPPAAADEPDPAAPAAVIAPASAAPAQHAPPPASAEATRSTPTATILAPAELEAIGPAYSRSTAALQAAPAPQRRPSPEPIDPPPSAARAAEHAPPADPRFEPSVDSPEPLDDVGLATIGVRIGGISAP